MRVAADMIRARREATHVVDPNRIRQEPTWCTCDGGTCMGCLIEDAVAKQFGADGLRYLLRHLNLRTDKDGLR